MMQKSSKPTFGMLEYKRVTDFVARNVFLQAVEGLDSKPLKRNVILPDLNTDNVYIITTA